RKEIAVDSARLNDPGPTYQTRGSEGAFESGRLFSAKWRRPPIRPAHHLGPVVSTVDDDGVICDPEVIELFQQLSNHAIMLDHPVRVETEAGLSLRFGLEVGEDVHPGAVEPDEKRLGSLVLPVNEVERAGKKFFIHGLHALPR